MLEKSMKKKNFRLLIYIVGAFIEVVGFALLFSFDKTMAYLHKYPIGYALAIIFTGYLLAISMRFKN